MLRRVNLTKKTWNVSPRRAITPATVESAGLTQRALLRLLRAKVCGTSGAGEDGTQPAPLCL